jgi:hypothetical protein
MYQNRKEHNVEHNIPPIIMVGIEIRQADWVIILQTNESKIRPSHQHQLLPREQI